MALGDAMQEYRACLYGRHDKFKIQEHFAGDEPCQMIASEGFGKIICKKYG
jgi:hypothetical protein